MDTSASETRLSSFLRANPVALGLCAAAFLLLFWPTLAALVRYWWEEPDFSHGFLIPLVSGTILVANRKRLGALSSERSYWGLVVLFLSLLVFSVGYLSFTNILQRLACWGALVGAVGFLLGTALLRAAPFPFFFLLFSIPPPFTILSPLRIGLKGFATRLSADALGLLGMAASPEGNVLAIDDHRLEVADACSGIRSLMAIVSTAVLFSYLFRTGLWKGLALALVAIPVTVAVNVVRVVVIAVLLGKFDIDVTTGASHEILGLAVFVLSLLLLYSSWRFCDWFSQGAPPRRTA